ncbi:branched-chain amino acid ABC transporter permease [Fimbriiglobus ruber]|uniref:Branched-chain amino acid transport system permease protein LivM n=1 Tax=Fimbriiglobus ruber TaxID=1908690 RepID=A0A225EC66_9BACT|nr:branched-chain amino acid ABC transporter permease [Fimbriiglobus ruber]OWK46929.1 Branched-chain amino acid transport system permease protein LivM [Fimbriiglobus ruber]
MTWTAPFRYWLLAVLVLVVAYPLIPGSNPILGQQLVPLVCYAILALGLNVVVGYTGLLHLGIAAFFGIGAYVTGILTVPMFPFQQSFLVAVIASTVIASAVGVVTTAPTLRLRGDYLALVTLGFGLITTFAIRNLDNITDGTKGLNPVSPNLLPWVDDPDLTKFDRPTGWAATWRGYPYFYYICVGLLVLVMWLLRNLERSRLGRNWVALREDELAATCMGLNPARLKLSAIAAGAALAGLAGALYAVSQRTTAGPQAYDFNRSMITLCCVILGGLGSRPGVLVGVFLLLGYDTILTPYLDNQIQLLQINPNGKSYLKVSGWRLFVFGLALIVMMRFRPAGLLPAWRVRHELQPANANESAKPVEPTTGA